MSCVCVCVCELNETLGINYFVGALPQGRTLNQLANHNHHGHHRTTLRFSSATHPTFSAIILDQLRIFTADESFLIRLMAASTSSSTTSTSGAVVMMMSIMLMLMMMLVLMLRHVASSHIFYATLLHFFAKVRKTSTQIENFAATLQVKVSTTLQVTI